MNWDTSETILQYVGASQILIENEIPKIIIESLISAKQYPYLINASLNLLIIFSQK